MTVLAHFALSDPILLLLALMDWLGGRTSVLGNWSWFQGALRSHFGAVLVLGAVVLVLWS